MLAYELYTFNKKKGYEMIRGSPGEKKGPNENNGGLYHELGENTFR